MEDFRTYAALLTMATLPILAGSHASLKMPKEAKKRLRQHLGQPEPEEEEEDDEVDRLTASDAYWFPILGSCVLFTLFLVIKYFGKDVINLLLGGYMSLVGIGALARAGSAAVEFVMREHRWKALSQWKLSLTKNKEDYSSIDFNAVHLAALVVATAIQVFQHFRPNWILANMTALSFSYNAISLLRLDSMWTGSALLSLLFFYDIWWVFGSKAVFGQGAAVMETVAKSVDAPIKITFPRNLAAGTGFSLLGLGDIVLPGIFIALALRYDYARAIKSSPPPKPTSGFSRPYFTSCFVSYVLGLITTIVVMHCFSSAQPALLYLSPACIGSVVLCAIARGEWKELWAFDDSSNDPKQKEGEDGKDGEGKKEGKEVQNSAKAVEEKQQEGGSTGVAGQRVLRSRTKVDKQ